jgi:hypothetical protein
MFLRVVAAIAIPFALAFANPVLAKAKKTKVKSRPIAGISCSQGPQSIFIGASRLKPELRAKLRIGQRAIVNVAGVGPVDCFVR